MEAAEYNFRGGKNVIRLTYHDGAGEGWGGLGFQLHARICE